MASLYDHRQTYRERILASHAAERREVMFVLLLSGFAIATVIMRKRKQTVDSGTE